MVIVMTALSFLFRFIEKEPFLFPESSNEPYIVEVKQTSWRVDGNQLRFQGAVRYAESSQKIIVNYTVKSEEEKVKLSKPYRAIVVNGIFKSPKKATNANLFDYEVYLKRQNIRQILYADVLMESQQVPVFHQRKYILDSLRMKGLAYSDRVFSLNTSLYIRALLFADRSDLSVDVLQSFKNLGLMHLLSISGLHISLLVGGLNKLLLKLRISRESSMVGQLIFLAVYAVLTGLGASIYRASVQHAIKNIVGLRKQTIPTLDCWSLALILLLLLKPSAIYTASFQLSFSLSFLIIFLSDQKFFKKLHAFHRYTILNFVLFIVSIPILSYHFFEFSFGALLFNSIYIPFISFVLIPFLVVLLISSFIFIGTPILTIMDQLCSEIIILMETITLSLEQSVSFSFISGRLSMGIMLLWGLTVVLFLLTLDRKTSWQSLFLFLLIFSMLAASNRINPYGEIVMIDVGQGDAVLIKEPFNKEVTLIDTGGVMNWRELEEWERKQEPFTMGSHILAPLLKSMGISRIDTVVITHLHYDHYGELASLTENIEVISIAGTAGTLKHPSFQNKLLEMDSNDLYFKIIETSTESFFSDRLTVLKDTLNDKDNINNQSVVMVGKYGKLVWMFTGDIEFERENQLLKDYPNLRMDVLKVAHHGSSTSSTEKFIEQTKPEYALISVGEINRYAHPNEDVLQRLEKNKTSIFRTDYNGSIHYRFSDYKLLDDWISKNEKNFWINSSRGDN